MLMAVVTALHSNYREVYREVSIEKPYAFVIQYNDLSNDLKIDTLVFPYTYI